MKKPELAQWGFNDKDTFIRLYNQNIRIKSYLSKKYRKWEKCIDVISAFPTIFVIILIIYVIPEKELTPPILEIIFKIVGNLLIWLLLFLTWEYTFTPLSYKLYDIIINKRMKKRDEKLLDMQVTNYCNALKQYHKYICHLYGDPYSYQVYTIFEYWEDCIIRGEKI